MENSKLTVIRLIVALVERYADKIKWNISLLQSSKLQDQESNLIYDSKKRYLIPHLTTIENIELVPNYLMIDLVSINEQIAKIRVPERMKR